MLLEQSLQLAVVILLQACLKLWKVVDNRKKENRAEKSVQM